MALSDIGLTPTSLVTRQSLAWMCSQWLKNSTTAANWSQFSAQTGLNPDSKNTVKASGHVFSSPEPVHARSSCARTQPCVLLPSAKLDQLSVEYHIHFCLCLLLQLQTWLGCMYSSRYVLQRRLSQSSVMCPPYIISPNRYLRSSHGTFIIIIMKIIANIIIIIVLLTMLWQTAHQQLHALKKFPCNSLPVTPATHPTCALASR